MGCGRPRDEAKASRWRRHFAAQRASGLSVRRYCATKGLEEAAFYRWHRTLRIREGEGPVAVRSGGQRDSRSAQRSISLARNTTPAFVEIVAAEDRAGAVASWEPPLALVRQSPSITPRASAGASGLSVEFPCGARVRLEPGFDSETFSRVARALLDVAPC